MPDSPILKGLADLGQSLQQVAQQKQQMELQQKRLKLQEQQISESFKLREEQMSLQRDNFQLAQERAAAQQEQFKVREARLTRKAMQRFSSSDAFSKKQIEFQKAADQTLRFQAKAHREEQRSRFLQENADKYPVLAELPEFNQGAIAEAIQQRQEQLRQPVMLLSASSDRADAIKLEIESLKKIAKSQPDLIRENVTFDDMAAVANLVPNGVEYLQAIAEMPPALQKSINVFKPFLTTKKFEIELGLKHFTDEGNVGTLVTTFAELPIYDDDGVASKPMLETIEGYLDTLGLTPGQVTEIMEKTLKTGLDKNAR